VQRDARFVAGGADTVEALERRAQVGDGAGRRVDLLDRRQLAALADLDVLGRVAVMRAPLRGRAIVTRVMPGDEEGSTFQYSYNLWQGILYSAGVGFISSLLGIGGGVVHVPIMITLLRFPVHVAVATSHFVLAISAASGSAVHLSNGDLAGANLLRALLLSAGVIPGAQLGARLAQRFKGPAIVRLLAVALFALGIRLLLSAVL
jgi:hypothetical protein